MITQMISELVQEVMSKTIAEVAHEVNRAYCEAIGDFSQPKWEDAPDWQKDSASKGVKFHLKNPNATPEESHKNWLAQKLAEGWVYGEVKDVKMKTHPCIVENYQELPLHQRVKDNLFMAVVRSVNSAFFMQDFMETLNETNL